MWSSVFVSVFFFSLCSFFSLNGNVVSGLRLVQYNTEWLFYDYYAPADCPGAGCTWPNQSAASTHIQTIGSRIAVFAPDLANLCEVESVNELNMLKFNGTAHLVKGTDTATGQNVGLLSRLPVNTELRRVSNTYKYPIENSTCGYTGGVGSTGVSKHYYTVFDGGDDVGPFALVGVHLLAYPTDPTRCAEREAQAVILQELVWNLTTTGYDIVVMGDFNDYDGDIVDAQNDKPLSSVLDIVKGQQGPYAGKYELMNAAAWLNQTERWSDWWDKNGDCVGTYNEMTMIDHVLLSPNLFARVKNVEIWHNYDEYCGKWDSDHYPVIVDLDL